MSRWAGSGQAMAAILGDINIVTTALSSLGEEEEEEDEGEDTAKWEQWQPLETMTIMAPVTCPPSSFPREQSCQLWLLSRSLFHNRGKRQNLEAFQCRAGLYKQDINYGLITIKKRHFNSRLTFQK